MSEWRASCIIQRHTRNGNEMAEPGRRDGPQFKAETNAFFSVVLNITQRVNMKSNTISFTKEVFTETLNLKTITIHNKDKKI